MPLLNKCLKLKEGELYHISVEEAPIMKSTPLHIVWREEKKKTVQEEGPMVVIVTPMLQRLSKEEPQLHISNEDWETCIEFLIGQGNPGQINSRQTSRLGSPLLEALDELSPPTGIQDVIWKKFRRYTEYIADEIHKSRKAGVDLPKKVETNPPKPLDTLIKAEQSLSMPCQKDKTSSMEECQQNAIKILRNPPMMTYETSSLSSNMMMKTKDSATTMKNSKSKEKQLCHSV